MTGPVLTVADVDRGRLHLLLESCGMQVEVVPAGEVIPGSYWGAPEAGLLGARIFLQLATPVHSALHEAAHYLCMTPERQRALDRDAGGDFDEENAVCYLQILLAGVLPDVGVDRMLTDMDEWGYTFRLGSARRWFEEDAVDVRQWLIDRALIPATGTIDQEWLKT